PTPSRSIAPKTRCRPWRIARRSVRRSCSAELRSLLLLRRGAASLTAFSRDREEPLHVLLADDVRVRTAAGALLDEGELCGREVVLRVIGEHHVGSGARRQVAE